MTVKQNKLWITHCLEISDTHNISSMVIQQFAKYLKDRKKTQNE
ncbi:hypothetical protein [Bacillus sp. 165]|nr:hypothetical protein [Bacillus sp. 165]